MVEDKRSSIMITIINNKDYITKYLYVEVQTWKHY